MYYMMQLRPIVSAQIKHGGSVRFNSDWTFYHVSLRRVRPIVKYEGFPEIISTRPRFFGIYVYKVVEEFELCLALNAMPQTCAPIRYGDDCFYYRSRSNNVVIASGTLPLFLSRISPTEWHCLRWVIFLAGTSTSSELQRPKWLSTRIIAVEKTYFIPCLSCTRRF